MHADDAITEALEADNLTLQNMSGGKYVQGNEKFKQMVNDWQTKLGTVESVLTCWGDVQKKWQALESIFIGSADIRVQLPEDSKRFDAINADFQDLMRGAPDVTRVVDACNLEGRDERLNNLLSQLEMCEKALQVRAGRCDRGWCWTMRFTFVCAPLRTSPDWTESASFWPDACDQHFKECGWCRTTWRQSVSRSRVSTLSRPPTCWTSSRKAPTRSSSCATCPNASTACATWSSASMTRVTPPKRRSPCTIRRVRRCAV